MNQTVSTFICITILLSIFIANVDFLHSESFRQSSTFRQPSTFRHSSTFQKSNSFLYRLEGILKNHYEGEKLNKTELIEGAATGIINKLNEQERERKQSTHTFNELITPSDYKLLREAIHGKFSGIGTLIKKSEDDKSLLIMKVFDKSSAREAGIIERDKIIEIDSEKVQALSFKECIQKLRGRTGSTVHLTVLRSSDSNAAYKGKNKRLHFTVKRKPITVEDVQSKILSKDTAVIKIVRFSDSTPILLVKTISEIRRKGICKLILDLRNNPGGEFTAAIKVADIFLSKNKTIVSTVKHGKKRTYRTKKNRLWYGKLVCLVNKATASAAEIVAGCIKSSNSGLIAGQPTFGKDSVQTVFKLPEKYGLKLTTSRLLLEGCTPNKGIIEPNIYLDDSTGKATSDSSIKAKTKTTGFLIGDTDKDLMIQSALSLLNLTP